MRFLKKYMEKPTRNSTINTWYNKKGGAFGETKSSSKNPNHRKGAIFPWVPVVNYKRVNFTDGEYKVREYSQGSDIWCECANLELHRHSRERQELGESRRKNNLIFKQALKMAKEKKADDRNSNTI